MIGVALYRLRPPPVPPRFEALMADIQLLASAGEESDAADAAANLLANNPPLPALQQARLHDFLANLIYQRESRRDVPNPKNLALLVEHHEQAEQMGMPPTAERLQRIAAARDWCGRADDAIAGYRAALDQDPTADARRRMIRRLVALLGGRPDDAAERRRYLYTLLADEGADPHDTWWALRRAFDDALTVGDQALARQLLERFGDRLKSSDLKAYSEYLEASLLVAEGRMDEAAPVIQWVDEWLQASPLPMEALAEHGNLPALNRCLLGELELAELRPRDALRAFSDALEMHPEDDVWISATVGRGQALSMLERHSAALQALRDAAAETAVRPSLTQRGRTALRVALVELFERQHERRALVPALAYLKLAVELTPESMPQIRSVLYERLGRTYVEAADQMPPGVEEAEYRCSAARSFETAAPLAVEDGERYQTLLWDAAEQYDRCGLVKDARRMLTSFVNLVDDDPRLAEALLNLGRGYQVDGLLEDAVAAYRRLIDELPALPEAARAMLHASDCLIALGPERYEEAEQMLDGLLDGKHFGPEAEEFRAALLRRCQLLYREGRYADAIAQLEALDTLYPNGSQRAKARFLLAETYRRSALALRAEAADSENPEAYEQQAQRRLRLAADLYQAFLGEIPAPGEQGPSAATLERLARFNRGDCLLALSTVDALREALEAYEQAAVRYEQEPASLAAQVQLANIHLRLGEMSEAARAVVRAQWLLRNIPDQAFRELGEGTDRGEWDEYLTAVASSHLFREMLTD